MTEKRFKVAVYDEKAINGFTVLDLHKPNSSKRLKYENVYIGSKEGCDIVCKFGNELADENEKLKQQLEDITLNWTQNYTDFDKDELYVKDHNTEITLKGQNLFIQVFIPKIKEYFRFNYIVTGRRLEKEYNTLKGDYE